MPDPFRARIDRGEGVVVLALGGDIGTLAQARIRTLLTEVFGEPVPADVLLDLTEVTFIDNHGLAIVEFARRIASAQGVGFSVVTGPVVAAAQQEARSADRRTAHRRPATGSIFLDCRLCWRRIKLRPERVEVVDNTVVYRCQDCESPFLIRWDDAAGLGVSS
ncbi:MAG: hypothetical protein QOH79_1946 [Acidimicrobiaceae bacterium]